MCSKSTAGCSGGHEGAGVAKSHEHSGEAIGTQALHTTAPTPNPPLCSRSVLASGLTEVPRIIALIGFIYSARGEEGSFHDVSFPAQHATESLAAWTLLGVRSPYRD
jgi:hypothetical protein